MISVPVDLSALSSPMSKLMKWNPEVWLFKWKLLSSNFLWYYLLSSKVVLSFESVDEFVKWDHSNESCWAVPLDLFHAVCFAVFWKIKFAILTLFPLWLPLGVKGLNNCLQYQLLSINSCLHILHLLKKTVRCLLNFLTWWCNTYLAAVLIRRQCLKQ